MKEKATVSRTRSRRHDGVRQARELVIPIKGDAIARRAYALYVDRGRADGRDLDDWLTAERELTEFARQQAAKK